MEDNMKRNREMPCDNGERDWMVNNLPAVRETWVRSLGWEDPLEKEMATDSNILAWRIPTDSGAWWATVYGVAESDMTEQQAPTASDVRDIRCWKGGIEQFSSRAFRGSRALLTPSSWTSGLWHSKRIHVRSFKSCPWWYIVSATLGNYWCKGPTH